MALKLGIIGLGKMGTHHHTVAQQVPNLKIEALVDPQIKTIATPKKILTDNYKKILSTVDAVIIATPTPTHYKIAYDCLDAGLHVLLEKPMTQTIHEATSLLDKALQKNVAFHIGHVERFNPAFLAYKKESPSLPSFIESSRVSPFSNRVSHDSVILDLMIHDIDLIIQLIDASIQSTEVIGTKLYSKTSDLATAIITFTNNIVAHCHASRIAQNSNRLVSLHTNQSTYHINCLTKSLTHFDKKTNTEKTIPTVPENALLQQLHYFINAITTNTNKINSIKDLTTLQLTLDLQKRLLS